MNNEAESLAAQYASIFVEQEKLSGIYTQVVYRWPVLAKAINDRMGVLGEQITKVAKALDDAKVPPEELHEFIIKERDAYRDGNRGVGFFV